MKYLISISLLILITGCVEHKSSSKVKSPELDIFDLTFSEDKKHNVICYRFESHNGISCLQINK